MDSKTKRSTKKTEETKPVVAAPAPVAPAAPEKKRASKKDTAAAPAPAPAVTPAPAAPEKKRTSKKTATAATPAVSDKKATKKSTKKSTKTDAEGKKTRKTKKEKRPVSPNRPKRPMTAYFVWKAEVGAGLKNEFMKGREKFSVPEFAKYVSSHWETLDATKKKRYESDYQKKKNDFTTALAKYKESKKTTA